ncbi:MAG: pyridoxal phosphate-dependent aminotransferase, partial [Planctomycetota bacterium]
MSDFPFLLLRPDVPQRPAFAVKEVPWRAKLDQNESPIELPDDVKQRLLEALARERWHRYPQPKRYAAIKTHVAEHLGCAREQLIITAGCDQVILLAFLAAGGPGRRARVFEPCYPLYGVSARTTGTPLDSVVLGPDYRITAQMLDDPVALLVLTSPNNPTGTGPDRDLIEAALRGPATGGPNGLVLVDEAYADFAGESVLDLVDAHPNLLIGRSLSKSALAGVRLGLGVGHPELINVLERLV